MKLLAYCWTCQKEYDIGRWSAKKNGVKCDNPECSGYVISPSGKVQFKIVGEITEAMPTISLL